VNTAVRRINTEQNTLLDSVHLALGAPVEEFSREQFALASIHRFENIFFRRRMTKILELVELASTRCQIVFVLHPATGNQLKSYGLLDRLETNARIRLVPRMGFFEFIRMAKSARFVITDGGSNQEELSYLGVPTLLMRKATERIDGLGSTATVCSYDRDAFVRFLELLPGPERKAMPDCISPSRLIADHLEQFV
jgi:UDP-N-acetylglucosamine 2-epimerase (non-hydrolysing)